jgi:hypothetical protein
MTILPAPRFRTFSFLPLLTSFALGLSAFSAQAGVLEMKAGDKSMEGVKLTKEATFQSEGKSVTLKPYLSGLRRKKVALFWAKVYVGQIFISTEAKTPPDSIEQAATELAKAPVVAITMTFVRDVSASRQKAAFAESLKNNGVDPDSAEAKPLLDTVVKAGDAEDKHTTTIVFERRKDGSEWMYYENGHGVLQSSTVAKGMIAKIQGIWVGKPVDSGMERIQREFLGKED